MSNNNGLMDELPSFDRSTTFALGSVFLLASFVTYGDATLQAFGYDLAEWLSQELFGFGGGDEESVISVSYAHAVSILAILGAYIGNNADMTEFSDHQTYLGIATVALVLLPVLSTDIMSVIMESDMRALAYVAVQFVAYIGMVEQAEKASRGWA